MRHTRFRFRAPLVGLVVALTLLAACGGQPTPTPTPAAAPTTAPASPTAPSPAAPSTATAAPPAPTATATMPPATATATAAATGAPTSTATVPPAPTATRAAAAPPPTAAPPTPTASQAGQPQPGYLDDRSTAEAVIRSYYDAINHKQYARAYSYWESGVAAAQLPPFPQFQQGYADTAAVRLTTGQVGGDVGAGQLYYSVPVVLTATTSAGATQRFAGCYTLHLARPRIQAAPPFHPLAIQSASIQQAPAGASDADLLARACAKQAGPPPGAPPGPPTIDGAGYLDDRSSADAVLRSFYNAIDRQEYARAYSYWEPGAAQLQQVPPFPQFQQGYAQTATVQLTTGQVTTGAAAGNLYFDVPVTLRATATAGSTQTFVGCYRLHLGQPANQAEPPYQPIGIQSAHIRQVSNDADTAALMAQSCP